MLGFLSGSQEGKWEGASDAMHPLGIFKISNTNSLISPLKSVRHFTASTCFSYWTTVGGNKSFSSMYIYVGCCVQCYRAYYIIKVLILLSRQRRFLYLSIPYINIYKVFNKDYILYRAFHSVLRDYKHLYQENQRIYLNRIFHSHRKTDFFFQLEMFDVCTTGDTAHINIPLR
jgi:hypothetical protein